MAGSDPGARQHAPADVAPELFAADVPADRSARSAPATPSTDCAPDRTRETGGNR